MRASQHDRRGTVWNRSASNGLSDAQIISERIGYFINGTFRDAAPGIRTLIIKVRMSAPHNKGGRGKYLQKNPLSAGCRRIEGNLQDSVRITVTTPGTNARNFRGLFRLSSKCGGAKAPHAGIQEANGRLQFGSYTTGLYRILISEIREGVAAIAAQHGGTVR